MAKQPSENIIKLRELIEKSTNPNEESYETVLKRLKKVVDEGKKDLGNSISPQNKIKCYEKMCVTITSILNEVEL